MGVEVLHVGLDEYFNNATSDPVARAIHRKPWDELAAAIARTINPRSHVHGRPISSGDTSGYRAGYHDSRRPYISMCVNFLKSALRLQPFPFRAPVHR